MVRFNEYMHEWLYAKEGYYATHKAIGKEGDFYTAVSSSMFFGGSIAKKFINSIEEGFLSQNCAVVEVGAHKGYLLADIVQFIYTLKPELLKTLEFIIVEPFEQNQKAQLAYFQESFGDAVKILSDMFRWGGDGAFVINDEIRNGMVWLAVSLVIELITYFRFKPHLYLPKSLRRISDMLYVLLMLLACIYLRGEGNVFIYFQF